MFADFFILAAAVVALLALLDLLLADRQRKALQHFTMGIWDFLDDLKRLSLVDLITRRSVRVALSIVCAVSAFIGMTYTYLSMEWDYLANISVLGPALLLSALTAVVVTLWATFTIIFATEPLPRIRRAARIAANFTFLYVLNFALFFLSGGSDPFALLVLFGGLFQFAIVVIAAVVGLFWILPRLLALVIAVPLYMLEFVIRRIAESPRGVILAFSVLIGAIAAVLKIYIS